VAVKEQGKSGILLFNRSLSTTDTDVKNHTTGHFKFWGCVNLPGLEDLEGLTSHPGENVQ
jgi:hypothetical protein